MPAPILTVKTYHLDLNEKIPVNVQLPLPANFKIKINDPENLVTLNSVWVEEKDLSYNPVVSIKGANDSITNELTVTVSGTAQEDQVFEYFIVVDGVGLLDPKIKIIPP
jgi:hypothetical protein